MTSMLLSKNVVIWRFVIVALFFSENSNPDLPLIIGPSSSSVKFKCKDSALGTNTFSSENKFACYQLPANLLNFLHDSRHFCSWERGGDKVLADQSCLHILIAVVSEAAEDVSCTVTIIDWPLNPILSMCGSLLLLFNFVIWSKYGYPIWTTFILLSAEDVKRKYSRPRLGFF